MKSRFSAVASPVLIVLLAFATQYYALGPKVDDVDEATFMIVAQSVLRGALPYELALDNKPAGLFYLLAGVMAVFGQSLETVRLFGDAAIAGTALILLWLCRRYLTWPLATALVALFVLAHLGRLGDTTKSEAVANFFVACSLYVLVARPTSNLASLMTGILVSSAVLIRTNLAYLALALALLHLLAVFRPQMVGLRRSSIVALVAGGLVPLTMLIVPYALRGELLLLWAGAVEIALSQSRGSAELFRQLTAVPEGFFRLRITPAMPLVLISGIGLWKLHRSLAAHREWRRDAIVGGVYFLAVAVSIAMSGTFFDHYMLQLFPPMVVLAAIGLGAQRWNWRCVTPYLLGAGILSGLWWSLPRGLDLLQSQSAGGDRKPTELAAAAIGFDLRSDDKVWALPGGHLVLFYLDRDPILPVAAFPSNLTRSLITGPLARLGLMPTDGAHAAFELRPRFIVSRQDQPPEQLDATDQARFAETYRLWWSERGIFVFKRLD